LSNQALRLDEEIRNLEYQTSMTERNIGLLEENITLYQERFDKGQINAYDLFNQEMDLQKEKSGYLEQRAGLMKAYLDRISNSGNLGSFIGRLR
jgi:outer membrane protein TolC